MAKKKKTTRKAKRPSASRTRAIRAARPEITLSVKPTAKLKDLQLLEESIFDGLLACPNCFSGLDRLVLENRILRR